MAEVTYNSFIPMYIKLVLGSRSKEVVTADRWNELWNLAIAQGDHNSEGLASICTDYTMEKAANASAHNNFSAQLQGLTTTLLAHNHNTIYYTKTELDPMLRGADTRRVEEVFTIVNANLGNGTFTYKDKANAVKTGTLTAEGHQIFTLQEGKYILGSNMIEATVNDTLRRSPASGGITEVDDTHFALTSPEGANAEISVLYFERVGLMGEHAITHQEGGSDVITVSYNMLTPDIKERFDIADATTQLAFALDNHLVQIELLKLINM